MLFKTSFKDFKLGTKFNLFLVLVFVVGISLSGFALSQALQQRSQAEIASKALILTQTMNAIRNYTQDRVNPLLQERLETEPAFTPEAIPTFAVREAFEYFRQDPSYRSFFYKDAAPNPTNLRDLANPFETQIVEEFRAAPELKEKSGFLQLPEGRVFYIARPFAITKQSCLECHSSPDIAPKSLLMTYGSERGFGWKLNDIVAAQMVYVPAEEILKSAHRSFVIGMGILLGTFAVVILLVNFLLKRTVIQRIRKIARTAQAVSMGDMQATFTERSNDEIGILAASFNRMKTSLEVAMKLLSQKQSPRN